VLYYAELNYAEKGIKAKLRRNFFSPVQNAEHAKLRRIAKLRRGFNVQGKNAEMVNDDSIVVKKSEQDLSATH